MNKQNEHAIIEKIKGLPPERVAEVEDFVDFLRARNDDQRLNHALRNQSIGGFAHAPVHAGNKRSCAVEKILAIVQVENREAALRLLVIAGRKIDDEVALVAKEARAELLMLVEVGSAHGTMITSRSLASTCWPDATSSLATRPEMGA